MILQTYPLRNGSKALVKHYKSGASRMAILDTIYYAFSNSRDCSVFSCESHLTLRLFFSRQNSAESWKVQGGRIRISISLDMPESWLNYDTPHQMIGATLSLIRNTNRNQWCDYCKLRWGTNKDGTWHFRAMTPAVYKIVSEHPRSKGITRFYCQACADESQNWPDGTFYSLKQQLEDALTKYSKGAYYDEQLA